MSNKWVNDVFLSDSNFLFYKYSVKLEDTVKLTVERIMAIPEEEVLDAILSISIDEIGKFTLDTIDIPQFSSFDDSTNRVIEEIYCNKFDSYTYLELGKMLQEEGKSDVAYRKYGENQSKTAHILGLTYICNKKSPHRVFLTNLGRYYLTIPYDLRVVFLRKLIMRSKLIRYFLNKAKYSLVNVREEIGFLSSKTVNRRLPNIMRFIEYLNNNEEGGISSLLKNIIRD